MGDFKLDITVQVSVKPVNAKVGTTQRGPWERNLFVVKEQKSVMYYNGDKADVALMVADAMETLTIQQPLTTVIPPKVTNVLAETPVSSTAFTVNGTVHDNDQSCVITCEFGEDQTLSETPVAATESPISGDSDQAVTMPLTSLTASTKYYYRIKVVATVTGEVRYSQLKSYTTPAT